MARILTITLNPALDLTVRLRQLELGAVNRSEAVLTQAAGKGLNVAQVLADLGHRLTVSGFLGEDNQPPFTAMFQRRGFADAFVRVPGETRSNIKLAARIGQRLGGTRAIHRLADETRRRQRLDADQQDPVGFGDLFGAQFALGPRPGIRLDAGFPAQALGGAPQQARGEHAGDLSARAGGDDR